jgi:hypothetical protein
MCPRTACPAATVEETVHEPLQQLVGVREAVSGILEVLGNSQARGGLSRSQGGGHARGGGEGGGGVLSVVDQALRDLCSRRGAIYDATMQRDKKMPSDAGCPQADGRAREDKKKIEKNSGGTHKSERGQGAEGGGGGVTLWNEGAAAGGGMRAEEGEEKKKEEGTDKEEGEKKEEEKEKERAGGEAFDSVDKSRRNLRHLGNLENIEAPQQVLTLLALLVQ